MDAPMISYGQLSGYGRLSSPSLTFEFLVYQTSLKVNNFFFFIIGCKLVQHTIEIILRCQISKIICQVHIYSDREHCVTSTFIQAGNTVRYAVRQQRLHQGWHIYYMNLKYKSLSI